MNFLLLDVKHKTRHLMIEQTEREGETRIKEYEIGHRLIDLRDLMLAYDFYVWIDSVLKSHPHLKREDIDRWIETCEKQRKGGDGDGSP